MGNCMTICDTLANRDLRALYHTCSIHPHGSSEKCIRQTPVLGRATPNLLEHYELGEVLGKGQFGIIRLCTKIATGENFACKSIAKAKLVSSGDYEDVRREIQIMQTLSGHPNIVQLEATYEDETWVHLVLELCEGGELFDRIIAKKTFSEREAAQVCKVLMEVLMSCHSHGIIHRDIKPENILLTSDSTDSTAVKVADFGLAVPFSSGEKVSGTAGSAYYIAPEVLKGDYGKEVDIWSAGVVLYIMLSGVPPFWDETEEGIFDAISYGHLDLSSDPWPKCSSAVKDLIKGILCSDIRRRLTPEQVLNHEWIRRHTESQELELPPDLSGVQSSFEAWSSFKSDGSMSSCSTSMDSENESPNTPFCNKARLDSAKTFSFCSTSDSGDNEDFLRNLGDAAISKASKNFENVWNSSECLMSYDMLPKADKIFENVQNSSEDECLVSYDMQQRRISWEQLEESQESCEECNTLWSSYLVPCSA